MTPKIIFDSSIKLSSNPAEKNSITSLGVRTISDIYNKRSKKYLDLLMKLDKGTITHSNDWANFIEELKEQIQDFSSPELLEGIIAKCYLGVPYEVHILDFSATSIVNHFKRGEPLPANLERARSLANHDSYLYVEVYRDKLVCIKDDGTPVVINE